MWCTHRDEIGAVAFAIHPCATICRRTVAGWATEYRRLRTTPPSELPIEKRSCRSWGVAGETGLDVSEAGASVTFDNCRTSGVTTSPQSASQPGHPVQGADLAPKNNGVNMYLRRLAIIAASFFVTASAFGEEITSQSWVPWLNRPWYPSLQAFEHYDSGRSHVFPQAEFRGSYNGRNTVVEDRSRRLAYPSGYNMSYLNAEDAFIQGGSYGNFPGSIGPFVAKVNPRTLRPIWFNQLRNTKEEMEWDYPGAMAIMNNGYIYVVSGYRIYKLDPADGSVVDTLVLPTSVYMRNNYPDTPPTYDSTPTEYAANTSYNGINAVQDGTIVVKSLYRAADCTDLDGSSALLDCPDSRNVPQSLLVSVDPHTPMKIISQLTLPNPAGARPTITRYKGVDYVYLVESTSTPVRYIVRNGIFTLDESWQPPAVANCGQQPGGSLIVMNDWVVGATNNVFAIAPLTVYAIHQGDASKYLSVQPYANDRIAPGLAALFHDKAPNGGSPPCPNVDPSATDLPAVSWADMSLEADPENGLFYGVETLARKVAAFRIVGSKIQTVWKKTQTTTEWATLIGPKQNRVWVGTDIPVPEIPGEHLSDTVVWRDAQTGHELARSEKIPHMTQGSAVQPGYDGSMYFPGAEGMLIKLTPTPDRRGH